MKLNELDLDIFELQMRTLNLKQQHLAEEYSQVYDSYGKGLVAMGEQLLQHADFLHNNREMSEGVSWASLFAELKRRSG